MKKYSLLLVLLFFAMSCGKYHIKNEINNSSALSKLKKTGIIIRLTHNTPIPIKLFNKNLSQWLEPYKKSNQIKLIEETSKNINVAKAESDRFLQFSNDGDFQYYQSMGIVKGFINKNKEELDKIKSENDLDSLIFYEVDAGYSLELQYNDFGSMVVIVDNNYKIVHLDRQYDKYDTFEIDRQVLKEELLDLVSNRLIDIALKQKYIKE